MIEITAMTTIATLIFIDLLIGIGLLWREIRRGWWRKSGDWRRKG